MTSKRRMQVEGFHDPVTGTVSYLLVDKSTLKCALIDSVLDYEPASGCIATVSADRMIARVRELGATVEWILETHVHADHLSAAQYIKQTLGGRIGVGAQIVTVQRTFADRFDMAATLACDGSQFDHLFGDDERFRVGTLQCRAMHTPGHTPACMTYVVTDFEDTAAFVGDTLFMPDCGTARCDFPGGDARTMYRSINRILSLPPHATLYMCHDYPPASRDTAFATTVAEERRDNIHVRDGVSEEQFVALRTARDATLDLPQLFEPSVRLNLRAGVFPTFANLSESCEQQPLCATEGQSSEPPCHRRA